MLLGGWLGLCGIQNSDLGTGSPVRTYFQMLSLVSRSIWYCPNQYFPLIPLCERLGGGDVDSVGNPEILNAAQVTYGPGFRKFVSACAIELLLVLIDVKVRLKCYGR